MRRQRLRKSVWTWPGRGRMWRFRRRVFAGWGRGVVSDYTHPRTPQSERRLDSMTTHEQARMNPIKLIAHGLVLTVASFCAHAYESDLHYGLTYWLATQAGYDPLQSQEIARQNELTDTGMLDAKHAIIWDLCILQDTKASLLTRALHFRAKREPPANPAERPVNSTAPYAMGQSNSMIVEPHHEDPDLQ